MSRPTSRSPPRSRSPRPGSSSPAAGWCAGDESSRSSPWRSSTCSCSRRTRARSRRSGRASSPGSNRFERALAAAVGANGRFVIVDHYRIGGAELNELGATNLNVFTQLSSAQGYGSLTWAPYAYTTGTHGQNRAGPRAFSRRTSSTGSTCGRFSCCPGHSSVPSPRPIRGSSRSPSRPRRRDFGGGVDVASVGILARPAACHAGCSALTRAASVSSATCAVRAHPHRRRSDRRDRVLPTGAAQRRARARRERRRTAAARGVRVAGRRRAVLADRTARSLRDAAALESRRNDRGLPRLTDTRAIGPFTAFTPSGTHRAAADVRVVCRRRGRRPRRSRSTPRRRAPRPQRRRSPRLARDGGARAPR